VTMSTVLFWVGFAIIGLGAIGSTFPLWKSSALSPDSIERRVYWTGCGVGVPILFVSQLSDWKSALFMAVAFALALVSIAFLRTNHIKLGGQIYAAFSFLRRPDRPPVLRPNDEVD
jgi:hypothetical protein